MKELVVPTISTSTKDLPASDRKEQIGQYSGTNEDSELLEQQLATNKQDKIPAFEGRAPSK